VLYTILEEKNQELSIVCGKNNFPNCLEKQCSFCEPNPVWIFQDFSVNQILREINLDNVEGIKLPFVPFLGIRIEFIW